MPQRLAGELGFRVVRTKNKPASRAGPAANTARAGRTDASDEKDEGRQSARRRADRR